QEARKRRRAAQLRMVGPSALCRAGRLVLWLPQCWLAQSRRARWLQPVLAACLDERGLWLAKGFLLLVDGSGGRRPAHSGGEDRGADLPSGGLFVRGDGSLARSGGWKSSFVPT